MQRTIVRSMAIGGVMLTLVAIPAIAKTMHHMMMQPTAKYGQGFFKFTSKAADCMDRMVQAARLSDRSDHYFMRSYVGCLNG
jgi:hypothetical protein